MPAEQRSPELRLASDGSDYLVIVLRPSGLQRMRGPPRRLKAILSTPAFAPCRWQASRRDRETLFASLGHRDRLLPSQNR